MLLQSFLRVYFLQLRTEGVGKYILTVLDSVVLQILPRLVSQIGIITSFLQSLLILRPRQIISLLHRRGYKRVNLWCNGAIFAVIIGKIITLYLILGKCSSIVLSLLLCSSLFSLRSRKLLHRLVEILGSRSYSASADRSCSLLLLTCSLFLCSLHARAHIASLSLLHRVHLVVAHVHQLPVFHIVCTRSSSRTRLLRSLRLLPLLPILSCHLLCPLRSSHWLLLRYWLLLRLRIYSMESKPLRKLLIGITGNSTISMKRIIELLSVMIALLARRIYELSEMFSSSRYCAISFQGVIKLVKFISSHILYINVYKPSFFVFLYPFFDLPVDFGLFLAFLAAFCEAAAWLVTDAPFLLMVVVTSAPVFGLMVFVLVEVEVSPCGSLPYSR